MQSRIQLVARWLDEYPLHTHHARKATSKLALFRIDEYECLTSSIRWNENEPTNARIQLPQKWEKLARKFHLQTTNTFETFQRKNALNLSAFWNRVCVQCLPCTMWWAYSSVDCGTSAVSPCESVDLGFCKGVVYLDLCKNSPQLYDFLIRNVIDILRRQYSKDDKRPYFINTFHSPQQISIWRPKIFIFPLVKLVTLILYGRL